jgi:hydroxymethylpyrimidine pyrophosphatase-like HAD family hydrolase
MAGTATTTSWKARAGLFAALWQRDLDVEMDQWVYVGDSTNDQLMFKTFANSVGVANIARFVPQLAHLPRYVTRGERGAGFTEVARALDWQLVS